MQFLDDVSTIGICGRLKFSHKGQDPRTDEKRKFGKTSTSKVTEYTWTEEYKTTG